MSRAIGEPFTTEETAQFVAAARARKGIRFRHQGRSDRGVDCAGLAQVCLAALGKPTVDMEAYSREPMGGRLEHILEENLGAPLAKDQARVGDIVLMRFRGEPQHVAIIGDYIYGGLSVIHAYLTMRKVVEHRLDDVWRSYITENGVYRP
jgi:cell wall-associated NlpC family hydrolase